MDGWKAVAILLAIVLIILLLIISWRASSKVITEAERKVAERDRGDFRPAQLRIEEREQVTAVPEAGVFKLYDAARKEVVCVCSFSNGVLSVRSPVSGELLELRGWGVASS